MRVSFIKRVLLAFMAVALCFQTFAQNSQYHIVASSETLASIARQYGISEDALKNANPTVGRVFYVGMKLVIPDTGKNDIQESGPSSTQPDVKACVSNVSSASLSLSPGKKLSSFLSTISKDDISMAAGLFFGTDFSNVVGFNYGVYANAYLQDDFGAFLSFSTNALSSSSGESDFIIKIGPSYKKYVISSVSVGGSICYALSFLSNNSRSACISGLNLMPFVGYSFGSFELSITLDAYVRNGHKGLRVGPYLGITYNFM